MQSVWETTFSNSTQHINIYTCFFRWTFNERSLCSTFDLMNRMQFDWSHIYCKINTCSSGIDCNVFISTCVEVALLSIVAVLSRSVISFWCLVCLVSWKTEPRYVFQGPFPLSFTYRGCWINIMHSTIPFVFTHYCPNLLILSLAKRFSGPLFSYKQCD